MINILDAEVYSIEKFMKEVAKGVKPTDRVLDAGAGQCPYKKYFAHARYESCDIKGNNHTFNCSLYAIPKVNEYDVIINTQVLEHVEHPQVVLNEFYRALKPNGRLFLTAPQGWGVHYDDGGCHYFNFTNYGLQSLFENAGFKIIYIKPRGGVFRYLGKRIRELPYIIVSQYLFDKNVRFSLWENLLFWIALPFIIILFPICRWLIPFICFFLDKLDKKQDFTLGYACYCVKGG